ncbi:MAB_1171c family putative transporter [Streptomyces naphthomycinicus]|uniref:MAB_1171c family putative transporter n=1 Tax=Streptomyces naphthomycinicus TaxID=2872625 RepID=UPI001CECE87B|nr:MAB_1171c family putative transporter [Streptomyces sp. TML10]
MSLVVYMASVLLALAAVLLRRPRRTPRSPLSIATRATAFIAAVCFFWSAPVTLAAVNHATGIANVGAPLTYSSISALSCSLIILLIHWKGGPQEQIRRMTRRAVAVYGTLIVAIVVLFGLADAHTERLTDLDTYYANTPYMREMIALYLMGHLASTIVLSAVCLKWARDEVTGLLRIGLRLILAGLLLDALGFTLAKVTAVVARWLGHDLDFLSTTVAPPAAALGALIYSAGFVLPRLASAAATERQSLTTYRALRPLWSAVKDVAAAPIAEPTWWQLWWQLPSTRLYLLEANIRDALLQLTAYFDQRVGHTAYAAAVERGERQESARIASEKAMIIDGIRRATGMGGGPADPPEKFRVTIDLVELAHTVHRLFEAAPEQVRIQ